MCPCALRGGALGEVKQKITRESGSFYAAYLVFFLERLVKKKKKHGVVLRMK